jgi:hypothetical protein
MAQSLFSKNSRVYKLAHPSERALKRRANMPGVKALSGLFLAIAITQINLAKTVNDSNTTL